MTEQTKSDDDAWADELESLPIFIVSQLQVGHVITEDDRKAIGALLSELDALENQQVDEFDKGYQAALRHIGGEDLVTSVKLKDEERIAHYVRKAMDRMFPKQQRKIQ